MTVGTGSKEIWKEKCLIYFAIPCLTHDTAIVNPTGTLPAETWEWAGAVLTFGFIPLLVVNVLGFLFVRIKQKCVRFIFFIPSVICLIILYGYWTLAMAAG